jgi:hypothetical protein
MKNQENIDKLFAERLKNYERQPRTVAWDKLQGRLEKKESKILPLWWKYASAASVALILGSGIYWLNSGEKTEGKEIATTGITKNVLVGKETKNKVVAQSTESGLETKQVSVDTHADYNKGKKLRSQLERNVILPQEKLLKEEQVLAKNPSLPQVPTNKIIDQSNTIVLVIDKEPRQEETIVLNLVDSKEEVAQVIQTEEPSNKRQSKFSKIWQQLKRAKNGENVNWNEVGFKPQKLIARADAKIENALTNGEETEK